MSHGRLGTEMGLGWRGSRKTGDIIQYDSFINRTIHEQVSLSASISVFIRQLYEPDGGFEPELEKPQNLTS